MSLRQELARARKERDDARALAAAAMSRMTDEQLRQMRADLTGEQEDHAEPDDEEHPCRVS